MPLDIEVKVETPKVEVLFSKTIELIAAIHLLADSKHHQFAEGLAATLQKRLSSKSLATLEVLAAMRLKGVELIEFVLKDKIFDDVRLLVATMSQYKEVDFIYSFLGEEISMDRIQGVRDGTESLIRLIDDYPVFANVNVKALNYLVIDTKKFRDAVIKLMIEVDCPEFLEKLKMNRELYRKSVEETKSKLSSAHPLEYAQEIMGKKLIKIFDFKEYYFIPSYFYSPHNIRFFNNNIQITVYDVRKTKISEDEIGDKVSELLKVISDRTRLEILKQLIAGAAYGKILAERLKLTTATISHHLEQLKNVGLIMEERKKNIKYFSANVEEIERLMKNTKAYLFNHIEENE